ncbi:MAG: OmpA family protein [Gammaproteobacteria bacterium]|nr:OmpA family protein [Gammaproteobacteria bacterium]
MKRQLIIFTTFIPILLSGCVSSGKHDMALAEIDSMRLSLDSAQDEINRNHQTIVQTEIELANARKKIVNAQEEIDLNQQQIKATELELETTRNTVSATQDDIARLEAKRTSLQKDLSDSRAQMTTLQNIEAETKRRNEIYAQFVNRLKTMIDGGQLTVSIEQGRIAINLPNNVLFSSGSANLNSKGNEALTQIAAVLSQFSDRRFQIEGHTDNNPIKSARFPSNWELSTSRALSVVHLLSGLGVSSENISAAGFGEFQPRASNDNEEGRQLNRRIEIIMQPNLEILSSELPDMVSSLDDTD